MKWLDANAVQVVEYLKLRLDRRLKEQSSVVFETETLIGTLNKSPHCENR